ENLRLTQSALPCDKIYALLGLCSSEEAAGNPIHYNLEPEEAYKTFIVTHVKLHQDLEFLGLCTPVQWDTVCRDKLGRQQYRHFYMTRPVGETPYTDELSRARAFSRTISLLGVYLSPVPSSDELPEMFYRWCQGSILGNQLEERGLKYQASQKDGLKGFVR